MKKVTLLFALTTLAITINAQNVGVGTSVPKAGFNVANGKTVLFGADMAGQGSKLLWHPSKAAFRVGFAGMYNWNSDSIGYCSFASGFDCKALGDYSTVMGGQSIATGLSGVSIGAYNNASGGNSVAIGAYAIASQDFAVAIGRYATATNYSSVSIGEKNVASGAFAVAMGIVTKATGESSVSVGNSTISKARGSFTSGTFNDTLDNPNGGVSAAGDRIFQLGNGDENFRSNAVTVLRNGNTGIGTPYPSVPLHIKSTNNNPVIIDGGNQLYITLAENGNYIGYIGSFAGNANDVELGTYGGNTTGSVILSTNNSPKLTVANNGNVGIGNIPASKLEVNGALATRLNYYGSSNGNVNLDNSATVWMFAVNGCSATLPDPTACANRRYTLVNKGNSAMFCSNFYNMNNVLTTSIPPNSSIEVIASNNTNRWEQIR